MRKFTIYNLQFTIFALIFTFYILHFTFPPPVYAATDYQPQPPAGGIVDFRPPGADSGVDIGKVFGFGGIKSLGEATSQLVTPMFSVAAALVVIYFLLGAFKYLKSGGNKEEVEGARQMITQAIVGFVILIFAFLILQFLLSSLFGITGFQIIQSQ